MFKNKGARYRAASSRFWMSALNLMYSFVPGSWFESWISLWDNLPSCVTYFLKLFLKLLIICYLKNLRMTERSNKTSPRSVDKTTWLLRCKFKVNSVVGKSNRNRSAELWKWLALITQASKFRMKILQFFNLKHLLYGNELE